MKKRVWMRILLVVFCFSLLQGCKKQQAASSEGQTENYPVTVGDYTLTAQPSRVVVLSENIADVILALGFEAVLKGKCADCTQSELSILPDVSLSDVKELKALEPDLIFVDALPENAEELALEGLPIAAVAPAVSRSDFERLYAEVAMAMAGKNDGTAFGMKRAQNVFSAIDDVSRLIPQSNVAVTACYLYDVKGKVASNDTLAGELLTAAGATNVFASSPTESDVLAALKIQNPAYIFCPVGLKQQLSETEGYKDLTAVQTGAVFEMDPAYMIRQGRTAVQAVTFIAGALYPQMQENAASAGEQGTEGNEDNQNNEANNSQPASSTPSGDYPTLQNGDTGDAVTAMQERLYELGYLLIEATGEFGDMTEQAVKDFQVFNGFISTGIAEEEMQKVLFSDAAVPADQVGE